MEVVIGMPFLALNNADIQFDTETFTWRSYSTAKVLPTARWVELMDKCKFAKVAMNENSEMFVMYILALELRKPAVHLFQIPLLVAL